MSTPAHLRKGGWDKLNDVLLAAFAWALSRRVGESKVRIDMEGHGREEILDGVDVSRTVGWFTTIFPVRLEVPAGNEPDWRGLVKSVRRQMRAVPGNGLGFGALRYLGSPAARDRLPAQEPGSQVMFNYLGQWGAQAAQEADAGLYRAVHGAVGQDQDPPSEVRTWSRSWAGSRTGGCGSPGSTSPTATTSRQWSESRATSWTRSDALMTAVKAAPLARGSWTCDRFPGP
ncbi:MAG TPA: condensation domain-containing protein [Micromonosporaceae bacterium]|nr:condensation domain-containing protein [Micromonosporaceae bacterium]